MSGTTLRLLLPLAVAVNGKSVFKRKGKLIERPIDESLQIIKQLGSRAITNHNIEVEGIGKIDCKKLTIKGNISSQFVSSAIIVATLSPNDVEIKLTTKLESKPYVDITTAVLRDFGIKIIENKDGFFVRGNQTYIPKEYIIEGDFSGAAFMLAAGAIAGNVKIKNLNFETKQGDIAILEILKQMGADIKLGDNYAIVKQSTLKGITIDAKDIPDLVPICAVLGCFATNTTKIINAGRLRIKESDRLAAITKELKKMGANIKEGKDNLTITKAGLTGCLIDAHNDHRIAMSCAIAALNAEGITKIPDAETIVRKSYPNFFDDLKALGADLIP
jgi:3-phosphoshikimate 1-carboxyvinyltransferase